MKLITTKWLGTTFSACVALLLTACADHSPDSAKKSLGGDYYRVGKDIYCGKQILPNVDVVSFRYIDWQYGKDKDKVYYCDVYGGHFFNPVPLTHVIEVLNAAQPEQFRALVHEGQFTGYGTDGRRLYYQYHLLTETTAVKFLGDSSEYYAVTDGAVYYQGKATLADAASLTHVRGVFVKDKKAFFAHGKRIYVHPAFAEVLGREYVRDRDNVYFGHKKISGAHACSFIISDEHFVAFDKDKFFYEESALRLDREEYRIALSLWQKEYRDFRLKHKKACPKKRISIPRREGEIQITDLVD